VAQIAAAGDMLQACKGACMPCPGTLFFYNPNPNSVEEPTTQNTYTLTVCRSDQGYISPGCASDGALWHGLHAGWCNLVIAGVLVVASGIEHVQVCKT
jgi:hypothetical protein